MLGDRAPGLPAVLRDPQGPRGAAEGVVNGEVASSYHASEDDVEALLSALG
jgi:hypothetical protein